MWQSPLVLVTVAAVIIGVAVIVFGRPNTPSNTGELLTPSITYPAGLANGTVLGKSDAPAVLQVYADFQCPICKQFAQQQLGRLVAEFVTPGKLRIEARDIRILDFTGSESLDMAVGAACAAEQNRYWQFHDYLYWNQGPERQGYHNRDFIGRIAAAVDLDIAAFNTCFDRQDVKQAIITTTAQARSAGISSTPTLVLNGQKVVGLQSYDALAAAIEAFASSAPSAAPSAGSTVAPSPAGS